MAISRSKLDIVFSLLVRERAGNVCEYSGKRAGEVQLECAHVEGRRSRSTRWHPDNAFCLSHASHRWFTENPLAWAEWVKGKLGEERYHAIYRLAHTPRKFTPRELEGLYQFYTNILVFMQTGRERGHDGRIEFDMPDPIPEATPRKRVRKKRVSKFKRKISGEVVLMGAA